MPLSTIRLELARTPDHPEGDPDHGYEFHAPVTYEGHLDDSEWPSVRELCSVRKFERGKEDEHGILVHEVGEKWAFSYDPSGTEDDEPFYYLSSHTLKTDDYVSLTEHDGIRRTFRVVSSSPYLQDR